MSPTQAKPMITTGRLMRVVGTPGASAAVAASAVKVASRGAVASRSRQARIGSAASAASRVASTMSARPVVGWRRKLNSVTTPKLPPPPRRPKNRSGFSDAEARTVRPSAVTTVYLSTLSQASPHRRASQPIPPPSVRPPTPVWDTLPAVVARPCGSVARSSERRSAPPPTVARFAAGSTVTEPIGVRSIITPPCGTDRPRMPWPPHFTAMSRSRSRACRTAAATSAAVEQRAMRPGRRSTVAFQISRCVSYVASPGWTSSPAKPEMAVRLGILSSLTRRSRSCRPRRRARRRWWQPGAAISWTSSFRGQLVEPEHVEGRLVEALEAREARGLGVRPKRVGPHDRAGARGRAVGHGRWQAGEQAVAVVEALQLARRSGEPILRLLIGDQEGAAWPEHLADRGQHLDRPGQVMDRLDDDGEVVLADGRPIRRITNLV